MEERELSFSVKMTPKQVFRFTCYHNYHRMSGVIGIILSISALIMLIVQFPELDDRSRAVLTVVALWFFVLEPVTLYSRAKTQVRNNRAYQKPLSYTLNQEGITVSQEEEHQMLPWERVTRVVETKAQLLLYSSKVHAFVFPKESMGPCTEDVKAMILKYTDGQNVKLTGKIRKR